MIASAIGDDRRVDCELVLSGIEDRGRVDRETMAQRMQPDTGDRDRNVVTASDSTVGAQENKAHAGGVESGRIKCRVETNVDRGRKEDVRPRGRRGAGNMRGNRVGDNAI